MFRKISFALFISCTCLGAVAQGTFIRLYDTNVYDRTSREVLPTSDGGYLIVGSSNNSTLNDCDVYLMKANWDGIIQWEKFFGGSKPDYAYSMIETTDGNYFITGYTQSFGGGDFDVYLLKVSPDGTKLVEKNIGGFGNEEAREIIKGSDGNYLIVGTSNSSLGSPDLCVWRIDLSGTVLSRWNFGGTGEDSGSSLKEFQGGGFVAVGGTESSGAGKSDVFIVKINADGSQAWNKTYGGTQNDEGIAVVVNDDGSFVLAVRDSSQGHDVDVRVLKYDAGGTIQRDKLFAGTEKDTPKRIRKTSDGGYIIGAISRSFGWIYPDMWMLKLNADCDTVWSRHIGWGNHEHCHDIKQSADGGYLLVGHSRSAGPAQEIMFVKTKGDGMVGVGERIANNEEFNLYPNPTSGLVSFQWPLNYEQLKVRDITGQQINTVIKSSADSEIDLSGYQPGVYLLSFEGSSGILSKRVVLLR